jgi:hypothetical protein
MAGSQDTGVCRLDYGAQNNVVYKILFFDEPRMTEYWASVGRVTLFTADGENMASGMNAPRHHQGNFDKALNNALKALEMSKEERLEKFSRV